MSRASTSRAKPWPRTASGRRRGCRARTGGGAIRLARASRSRAATTRCGVKRPSSARSTAVSARALRVPSRWRQRQASSSLRTSGAPPSSRASSSFRRSASPGPAVRRCQEPDELQQLGRMALSRRGSHGAEHQGREGLELEPVSIRPGRLDQAYRCPRSDRHLAQDAAILALEAQDGTPRTQAKRCPRIERQAQEAARGQDLRCSSFGSAQDRVGWPSRHPFAREQAKRFSTPCG